MKHIFLTFSFVFFGLTSVRAQSDTIRNDSNQINDHPAIRPADEKENSDLTLIPNDKIPEELRKTLLNDLYAGWESAGVYQNKITHEYTIELKTAGSTIKYRFDEKGQPITGLGSAPPGLPN